MNESELLELLEKHKKGISTEEEIELLNNWYDDLDLELDGIKTETSDVDLKREMWEDFSTRIAAFEAPVRKIEWFRYVAAAVLIIAFGFLISNSFKSAPPIILTSQVKPGGNKATLILEDGTEIDLNESKNGVLANGSGYEVVKLADGKLQYKIMEAEKNAAVSYNKIVTPNGGHYEVILPDGTKVWLNAASYLKYPSAFVGKQRKVILYGEGYFEVAKNPKMPFVVQTNKQEITVLGTHFNVNNYNQNEAIKTTLLEGSVSVKVNDEVYTLKPNQVIETNILNKTVVDVINAEDVIAWKNGYFYFKNANTTEVMKELERWYDVKLDYTDVNFQNKISGKIFRNVNLNEALESLSYLGINLKLKDSK